MKNTDKQDIKSRDVKLINRYGMHVRPAGLFAKTASKFNADIRVQKEGDDSIVPGKSIMALMTLEAYAGTVLHITAAGPEADLALDALEALINRKFDIPEEQ